jgi:hypothetical protein
MAARDTVTAPAAVSGRWSSERLLSNPTNFRRIQQRAKKQTVMMMMDGFFQNQVGWAWV